MHRIVLAITWALACIGCGSDPGPSVPQTTLPCTPTHWFQAHAPGGDAPYHVPSDLADGNQYQCFTFVSPFQAGEQATAFGVFLGDDRAVHHVSLYQTTVPQIDHGVGCLAGTSLENRQLVMMWNPGSSDWVMPDDVGLELPGSDHWLQLEIHYANALGLTDVNDSTGVALCTTDTPRPNSAGFLWLGTKEILLPPHATTSSTGNCPASVTSTLTTPLTLIATQPHMHLLGKTIESTITRVGGQRESLVRVDPWDFNHQPLYPLDPPVVIQPGDSIETTCTWDNTTDATVTFGLYTQYEMCHTFAVSYPIDALRYCVY